MNRRFRLIVYIIFTIVVQPRAAMDSDYITILEHLLFALVAGSLIGFERSYHGRPPVFAPTLWCAFLPAC